MKTSEKFSNSTDFELFKKAKKLLMSEFLGLFTDEIVLNLIAVESEKRGLNVIELANYAVNYEIAKLEEIKFTNQSEQIGYNINENEFYSAINSIYKDDGLGKLPDFLDSEKIIKPHNLILCKVAGISMNGFGFFDNNIAIGDKSKTAINGNFVIAEIENSQAKRFIKKFIIENGKHILRSSSPDFPDYFMNYENGDKIVAVVIFRMENVY